MQMDNTCYFSLHAIWIYIKSLLEHYIELYIDYSLIISSLEKIAISYYRYH